MGNILWSTGHQLKIDNIVKSDNCYIYDSNGNQFTDLESGVWCTSVGHNNKRINNLITSQINKITHTGFCYCNPQIEETAKKILEITNINKGKCEFLCSGSEAVEYGMRIARSITEKPLVLTFKDSYFGAYGDAALKNNSSWYLFDWLKCSCDNGTSGCTGECRDFQTIPFDKIGIFLFEPGSSSGLVRFPSQTLIDKIVSKISETNGIVMANEITTGTGRTGKWFGYQHYDIRPDIVAIGKGLGNGYPVSVTAVTERVTDMLKIKGFLYGQSHQNDPLGAIIASEVISIINEEKLLKRCTETGKYLVDKLLKLKNNKSLILDVRGRGLMIAVEFKRNSQQVYEELLKRGFITCKRSLGEVLRIDPALTVDKKTIDDFLSAFSEVIDHLG